MIKKRFIQLIDKYLSDSATANEQQLVEEYLKRLEANGSIVVDNAQEKKLKEAMWQQIQLQTNQQTAQVVQMPWYRRKAVAAVAIAASLILVTGLGILLFTGNKTHEKSITARDSRQPDSTISFVHREVNTTGKEKSIQLPDGSMIMLADKSEITYRAPFTDKRDIHLTGKGNFKVAKDKRSPFTVISGDISTTALGTEFTVTAFKAAKQIIVRLYEGKVVIKPVEKGNKRMKKDVYLSSGQEFIYGQTSTTVTEFRLKNTKGESASDDDPSLPQHTRGSWYMFNNQPLGQVFDQLADLYNVQIVYSKEDVQNKYFVGKFNKSDSLDIILKYITIANKLTITKKDNIYSISK